MLELKELLVETKSTWIDYPNLEGFRVHVAMISRAEITKMRKGCVVSKYDRKARGPVETLDEDKFVAKFTDATLLDWEGLTLEHLSSLALINLGDHDPSTVIEYSPEQALDLVKASTEFDTWLNEVVFDLDNFRN